VVDALLEGNGDLTPGSEAGKSTIDKQRIEELALKKSMVGALVLAAWGITMALVTSSGAIMLDGMFNFLSGIMSYFFIVVSRLVAGRESKTYPLGYFAYESLLVFLKGTSILILVVMAVYSNVKVLLAGGRDPELGLMVIYVVLAVLGCLTLYFISRSAYKKTESEILEAETTAWLINAVVSGAIGIALGIAMLLDGTALSWVQRYIDQILVILMSLAFIKEPLVFMKNGLGELLMVAPHQDAAKPIVEKVESLKDKIGAKKLEIIVSKTGRRVWVFVRMVPKADTLAMKEWQRVLDTVRGAVAEVYDNTNTEILLDPA
jgi:predicted Co/Zn/Cd cation transporter (cation efflux family)